MVGGRKKKKNIRKAGAFAQQRNLLSFYRRLKRRENSYRRTQVQSDYGGVCGHDRKWDTHTHTDIYVYTVYTYTQRIVLESVDQKLGEGKAAGLWLD